MWEDNKRNGGWGGGGGGGGNKAVIGGFNPKGVGLFLIKINLFL